MTTRRDRQTPVLRRAIFKRVPESRATRWVCETRTAILMRNHARADLGGFHDDQTLVYARVFVAEGSGECGVEGTEDGFSEWGHDAVDAATDTLYTF